MDPVTLCIAVGLPIFLLGLLAYALLGLL